MLNGDQPPASAPDVVLLDVSVSLWFVASAVYRLRGPFAVYRASIRLSSRRFLVQMNSASPNSLV